MMTARNIQDVLGATPFRPFEIHANGRAILIEHPEQVFFAQKNSTLIIDLPGHIRIVDIDHISGLDVIKRRAGGRQSQAKP